MATTQTWEPSPLQVIHSGPGSVPEHLITTLKSLVSDGSKPKALIITGKTLSTKTKIISDVEELLKKEGLLAGTFTNIGEHAPIANIKKGVEILRDSGATVLIGVGGGSPIDAAKVISKINHDDHSAPYIPVLAIPTTLSAAELTAFGGFTNDKGEKEVISAQDITAKAIIYDAKLTLDTPEGLWLSTGIRALDHAIEAQYRQGGQWHIKRIAIQAAHDLEENLRAWKKKPDDLEIRTKLQLASAMSLWPNRLGTPLGPSHALGYALGPPYGIGHGYCSVLTLPGISKLPAYAPYIESQVDVGKLVKDLGLTTTLSENKVPKEDLKKMADHVGQKLVDGGFEPRASKEDLLKVLEEAY